MRLMNTRSTRARSSDTRSTREPPPHHHTLGFRDGAQRFTCGSATSRNRHTSAPPVYHGRHSPGLAIILDAPRSAIDIAGQRLRCGPSVRNPPEVQRHRRCRQWIAKIVNNRTRQPAMSKSAPGVSTPGARSGWEAPHVVEGLGQPSSSSWLSTGTRLIVILASHLAAARSSFSTGRMIFFR